VDEGQLLMTQAERDRLVALKKAKKQLITQKQAAEEIGVTERHVRRLLHKLQRKGDQAVIHELRGRASNRKLSAELERHAVAVLSDPVYRGFGPTLAAEYLHQRHQITVTFVRGTCSSGMGRAR
jgi:predicted transcriptional regulator of viral defense system